MIVELKSLPKLKQVVMAADSHYRRHKAIVVETGTVQLSNGYWDGGSRYSYRMVHVHSLRCQPLAAPAAPVQFGGGSVPPFTIPKDHAVVATGVFRGKTATATVYINPDDFSSMN